MVDSVCFRGPFMLNEREMPARWYDLLRERMHVEQPRMRIVKDGYLIKDYELQEVLIEAHRLDMEMLLVMRQTIAEALAREEVLLPIAEYRPRRGELSIPLI